MYDLDHTKQPHSPRIFVPVSAFLQFTYRKVCYYPPPNMSIRTIYLIIYPGQPGQRAHFGIWVPYAEMSTSRPEGQPQLYDYPLGLSGSLYRPSSYFNRLELSSNGRLGRLVDISALTKKVVPKEPSST
jgi:hypothetical protein